MAPIVLLFQVAAGPPSRPTDLRAAVARPCPKAEDEGDIVVCGRPEERPRLARLPVPVRRSLEDAASFRLPGGGRGNVHAIQTQLPGAVGRGGAITLGLPFGKGRRK